MSEDIVERVRENQQSARFSRISKKEELYIRKSARLDSMENQPSESGGGGQTAEEQGNESNRHDKEAY